MKSQCRFAASAVLLFFSLAIINSAFANPFNTLDTIDVTGTTFEISLGNGDEFEVQFDDGDAKLTDCVATRDATLCIDSGKYIVDLSTWDPTSDMTKAATALYACENLGFDALKGRKNNSGTCTAIALSDDTTYVAGAKNKASAVAAIREDSVDCNNVGTGFTRIIGTDFCTAILQQERPEIVDMDWLEINALLVLENRDTVNIYTGLEPGNTTATKIAGSKELQFAKGKPKEVGHAVTLIAYLDTSNDTRIALGATTSLGRLIILGLDNTFQFDGNYVAGNIPSGAATCNNSAASYDVTQNASQGGSLFVSDSSRCLVHQLDLTFDGDDIDGFTFGPSGATEADGKTFTPLTVNVFEGVTVNFLTEACQDDVDGDGCPAGNGTTLFNFNLTPASAVEGTLWEIKGIPHCAWNPFACIEVLGIDPTGIDDEADARDALCAHASNVLSLLEPAVDLTDPEDPMAITSCGEARPELLELNATPLIPLNLIAQFDPASLPNGVFPDLVIPPNYQAQQAGSFSNDGIDNDNNGVTDGVDLNGDGLIDADEVDPGESYHFDALLFDTIGVQTTGLTDFIVDPDAIAGPGQLGCPAGSTPDSRTATSIVVKVSEQFESANCNAAGQSCFLDRNVATQVTVGCFNPARNKDCCSLIPVNLQPTRRQPAQMGSDWYVDSKTLDGGTDDSAPAKHYDQLFAELLNAQGAACNNLDGDPTGAALSEAICDQLLATYFNSKTKLVNALANTSTGDNCSGNSRLYQGHESQLLKYRDILKTFEGNFPTCTDGIDNDGIGGADNCDLTDADMDGFPDNLPLDLAGRHASLIGRTFVLEYVLNEMLLPSLPAACPDGWAEDDLSWITD